MKLATFEESGSARTGLIAENGVIDLAKADPAIPQDMLTLIREWPALESRVRALDGTTPHFALKQVRLKAPVPHPQKILAIGLNYADHIAESGVPKPERQIWFSKLPNAVNGPYDPIQIPKASTSVDYEAEFVVDHRQALPPCRERGRGRGDLRLCARATTSACATGSSTPRNGFSASRSTPMRRSARGSSRPTRSAIRMRWASAASSTARCGRTPTPGTSSSTCFDQIALLSEAMTLEPGDVIFTGTPGGVGFAAKPPAFLKAGDVVRVEIDRIGALEAGMVPEA